MAGQRRQREGSTSTADARAFLRWAQTHTTSVSIVSMQDSNAATSATGGLGAGGRRGEQQGTDRTTTTRVSSTAGVTPSHPRTFSSFFCSLIWSLGGVAAKASAIGGLSPTTNLLPRFQMPACVPLSRPPPKFRSPGLHLELFRDPSFKTRIHFYLWPFLVLAHVPLQSPDLSRFQCCIHPDRVSRLMLVLVPLLYFAEPTLSPS